jgi:hypothetical protein
MLLTLCAVPKPFSGSAATIQENALRSWAELDPRPAIVLLGDEEGVADAARRWGARHVPGIERSELGTPLVGSILATAEACAGGGVTCFVNADILLFWDFLAALERVAGRLDRFLMAGRRWRLDPPEPGSDLAEARRAAQAAARLGSSASSEYFAFTPGVFGEVPPFALGRYGSYDLWLLWRARQLGVPVVDATRDVVAVHQDHGYDHIDGGREAQQTGAEAQLNRALRGGSTHLDSLRDARFLLARGRVRRNVLSFGALHHRAWMLKRWMTRPTLGDGSKT